MFSSLFSSLDIVEVDMTLDNGAELGPGLPGKGYLKMFVSPR